MKWFVLCLFLAALVVCLSQNRDQLTYIHFLDVGQGDSILMQWPGKNELLVDGGRDDRVLEQLRLAMPAGDNTIEYIALSHADADHIAGLFSVVQSYQVGEVLIGRANDDSILLHEWLALLQTKQIPVYQVQTDELRLDNNHTLHFFFGAQSSFDRNNASLVFQFVTGQIDVLMTGDIEQEREANLVRLYGDQLQSEILKSPHHGSRTSSSGSFVNAVRPVLTAIEVGKDNSYGHPNQETLDTYASHGTIVFRTDRDGQVTLATDGASIWRVSPKWLILGHELGKNLQTMYNAGA